MALFDATAASADDTELAASSGAAGGAASSALSAAEREEPIATLAVDNAAPSEPANDTIRDMLAKQPLADADAAESLPQAHRHHHQTPLSSVSSAVAAGVDTANSPRTAP